jgi:hypothetical protein
MKKLLGIIKKPIKLNIKKIIKWIIFLLFAYFVTAFFAVYYFDEKEKTERIEKHEKYIKITSGLRNTKIFGIQLGDKADILLFQLGNIPTSYGNQDEVFDDSGLLKGTILHFLRPPNFTIPLDDFINEIGMEQAVRDCLALYEEMGKSKDEYSCLKPIQKNKDFSKYYISYHPYGDKKISSIIGKLEKDYKNSDNCVENLKPYANVIVKNIRKNNPNENIVLEDNFYPIENKGDQFPHIKFIYNKETILTIDGYCLNHLQSSFIGISDNSLSIDISKKYFKIIQKVNKNKKLMKKNDFDNNVEEKEKVINKQGL